MNSKSDKYGKQFWMAVDNDENYIVIAFPYLVKDDIRLKDLRLGEIRISHQ